MKVSHEVVESDSRTGGKLKSDYLVIETSVDKSTVSYIMAIVSPTIARGIRVCEIIMQQNEHGCTVIIPVWMANELSSSFGSILFTISRYEKDKVGV